MRLASIALAFGVACAAIAADETTCKMGSSERHITVEYADSESKAPCEVKYFKPSEGDTEPKTLWNAQNDASFCQEKAQGLIETLTGAGWQCNTAGASAEAGKDAAKPAADEAKKEEGDDEE